MRQFFCFLFVMLQLGCSLGFAYKKHILGKYYLVSIDDNTSIEIAYELENGAVVGKTPEIVIAYGTLHDSLIVAQIIDLKKVKTFYVIDVTKDNEYMDAVSGPLNDQELKIKIPEFDQSIMKRVKP